MKAKRLIALALAAVFMLSAAATPVFAAAALPQENAALEQQNDMVSIRLKATGDLVYGSNYKLEVQTNPADTQYIVVTKNAYNGATATLRTGTASDLTPGSVILVDYTSVTSNGTTIYNADTVYVLRIADDGTNPDADPTTGTVNYTVTMYWNNGTVTTRTAQWKGTYTGAGQNFAAIAPTYWPDIVVSNWNVLIDHPESITVNAGDVINLNYVITAK